MEREERVAFIGISNWALDPAKMNRGIMVRRGAPDVQELVNSARYECTLNDISMFYICSFEMYETLLRVRLSDQVIRLDLYSL